MLSSKLAPIILHKIVRFVNILVLSLVIFSLRRICSCSDTQLSLLQALTLADNVDQADSHGCMNPLIHSEVGLVVIPAALGVADNDALGTDILDHIYGDLVGVGTVVQLVAGLGTDSDVALGIEMG